MTTKTSPIRSFRTTLCLYMFLHLVCTTYCYSAENQWFNSVAGLRSRIGNYGESIHVSKSNEIIVAGYTSGDLEAVDSGPLVSFVSSYDSSGKPLWKTNTGFYSYDRPSPFVIDSDDNLLMLNNMSIVIRYSMNGQIIDSFQINQNPNELNMANCIGVSKNSCFIAGDVSNQSTSPLPPGEIIKIGFIHEYNTHAVLQNEIQIKGTNKNYLNIQKISANENSVTCLGYLGSKGSCVTFGNTTVTPLSDFDCFVVKYEKNGDLDWLMQFDNSKNVIKIEQIELSDNGNVYVCGSFEGKLSLQNKSYQSHGGEDAFLLKIRNTGAVDWVKTWGSAIYDDRCRAISISANGLIWATGIAATSYSEIYKSEVGNIFLLALDSSGVVHEDQLFQGNKQGTGCGITTVGDRVFVTGFFTGTLNIGSNHLSTAGNEYNLFVGAFQTAYKPYMHMPTFAIRNAETGFKTRNSFKEYRTFDIAGRLIRSADISKRPGLIENGNIVISNSKKKSCQFIILKK